MNYKILCVHNFKNYSFKHYFVYALCRIYQKHHGARGCVEFLNIIIMTQEFLKLKAEIDRLKAKLEKPSSALLSNEEARNLIGVSVRMWASLREKHIIPYVRIGRKILYKVEDINRFIDEHYVK